MKTTLIPEWAPVEAVILAWPHKDTDWAPWLEQVRQTYLSLIAALNQYGTPVLLLAVNDDIAALKAILPSDAKVMILPSEYNDTWARDYAFLTCASEQGNVPVEFTFNGWGQKFDACKDNLVNQRFLAPLCQQPLRSSSIVAEGGALEIDDNGHLLSTASCLFNPLRNSDMQASAYQETFTDMLGCEQFTVLNHGHLEGDDTDGHIDTLVRFTLNKGVVIQACENRPEDSHYAGLSQLAAECLQALPQHQQFLLPLPDMYNDEGERLPASYANYLIANNAVFAPIYNQAEDQSAIEVLQVAYPDHTIVPIDCSPLVQQFGSLHCISMQVPKNTFHPHVVAQLQQGVSIYGES